MKKKGIAAAVLSVMLTMAGAIILFTVISIDIVDSSFNQTFV